MVIELDEYVLLKLSTFDLSSSTVSYGNGNIRFKTTAFEKIIISSM